MEDVFKVFYMKIYLVFLISYYSLQNLIPLSCCFRYQHESGVEAKLACAPTIQRNEKEYQWENIWEEKEYWKNKSNEILFRSLQLIFYFCIFGLLTFMVLRAIAEKRKREWKIKRQKFKRSQQHIEKNKLKIKKLEEEAYAQEEQLKKIKKELFSARQLIEQREKKSSLSVDNQREQRIAEFQSSLLFRKIYTGNTHLTSEEWLKLKEYVDSMYPNFSQRLIYLYSRLSQEELRICQLVKIRVPVKKIALLMSLTVSGVSQCRRRLYKKLTGKPENAEYFDKFISDF